MRILLAYEFQNNDVMMSSEPHGFSLESPKQSLESPMLLPPKITIKKTLVGGFNPIEKYARQNGFIFYK